MQCTGHLAGDDVSCVFFEAGRYFWPLTAMLVLKSENGNSIHRSRKRPCLITCWPLTAMLVGRVKTGILFIALASDLLITCWPLTAMLV